MNRDAFNADPYLTVFLERCNSGTPATDNRGREQGLGTVQIRGHYRFGFWDRTSPPSIMGGKLSGGPQLYLSGEHWIPTVPPSIQFHTGGSISNICWELLSPHFLN